MVVSKGEEPRYRTSFSNGSHAAFSDTTEEKGGQSSGFRPHELLEAALACCMNTSLRMYADRHGISLQGASTQVRLNRDRPDETVFEYEIELAGPLTGDERNRLMQVAETCPVRRTLSRKLSFRVARDPEDVAGDG